VTADLSVQRAGSGRWKRAVGRSSSKPVFVSSIVLGLSPWARWRRRFRPVATERAGREFPHCPEAATGGHRRRSRRKTPGGRDWDCQNRRVARYRQLMQGPLGVYFARPSFPFTALGIRSAHGRERRPLRGTSGAGRSPPPSRNCLALPNAPTTDAESAPPALQPVVLGDPMPGAASRHVRRPPGRLAVFVKGTDFARPFAEQRG